MTWMFVVAGALAAAPLVAALAAQAPAPIPPFPRSGPMPPLIAVNEATMARGKDIYTINCATCHGSGRGDGPSAAGLPTKPADQTDYRIMDALNDVTLARRIQAGGLGMPSFPHVRGDDLVALVGYVRSLSRPDTRGVDLHSLAQDEVRGFQPVTDEALSSPPAEDWLSFRGTPDAAAFSALTQVTRENIGTLRLAWARAMEPGGQYSTPLVRGGTMFIAHPGDVVQALHATNGDLVWEFRWDQRPGAPVPARGAARPRTRSIRNMAMFGERLFHFTADRHLIALNVHTGALVWSVEETAAGIGHMAGPMIADGKIISGRSCAASGGPDICYIAAQSPDDGRELWRVRIIPRPGEPGDETWGGLPYERRVHVGAWGFGSYDPKLHLVYWGTSVPAPSLERLRGTVGHDVLYSNSTLAIDVRTGRVVWHYQHLPRDNWDLDHVFERILVDSAVRPDPKAVRWINPKVKSGEIRHVVTGIPGKTGIVYTLDRKTGEFLWARETIHQNVIKDIDAASGRVSIDESLVADAFVEKMVCPSLGGGKDWPAGAYSPRTGLMYQPQQNMCMLLTGNTDRPTPADGYATSWVMVDDPRATPRMVGRIDAISVETGRTAWVHEQRAGVVGSLLATAGGLVFGGDVARRFIAFDDTTGKVLWETPLSGPVSGHAISYAVNGRQYVAVPAGGDTASPEKRVLSLHPEIKPPQGQNALFVFALPPEGVRGTTNNAMLTGVAALIVGVIAGLGVAAWRWKRGRPRAAAAQVISK